MRIAVSADNKQGLYSVVSPHFGRCAHFILVDAEGDHVSDVQVVDNPFYGNHEPGQVPGFIASLGANVMLTGGMGGRALMFFQQYGIAGVTSAYGTVKQAVESYLAGQLRGAAPCRESQEHGHDLPAAGEFEKDELERLREEAELLRQQIEATATRLGRADQ